MISGAASSPEYCTRAMLPRPVANMVLRDVYMCLSEWSRCAAKRRSGKGAVDAVEKERQREGVRVSAWRVRMDGEAEAAEDGKLQPSVGVLLWFARWRRGRALSLDA